MISSYPSIFTVGHKAMKPLLDVVVCVEEKIDGSQVSFCNDNGTLRMRSKNVEFDPYAAPDMFRPVAEGVIHRHNRGLLPSGNIYRGETLSKPKHNALKYGRVPKDNFILFGVEAGLGDYLSRDKVETWAEFLDYEVVPWLWSGYGRDIPFEKLLENVSILGDVKIEGIVVKPSTPFYGPDKKLLIAKFVSEDFKEVHRQAWGIDSEFRANPQKTILEQLGDRYRTNARWDKAIQHLKEDGKLEGSPKDIQFLIHEVPDDILKECQEEIKDALLRWCVKDLKRSWTRGFAEYYKTRLMEDMLQDREVDISPSS